ncbi:GntR family transcriptional regulator [Amycolatopsis sp. NPDC058340]|uniref:GntR family transcriptional regulator n=1 Tax=Amycolatopsis sp. NPDC058340 TaxID=3346453 RepID=UPI00365B9139
MTNEVDRAGKATFEWIAEQLRRDIKSGELRPGDQLPNQREIAARFEVAVGTAQRALGQLQEDGWIVSRPGVGRVVSASPGREPLTLELLSSQVVELKAQVDTLQETVDRLKAGQS